MMQLPLADLLPPDDNAGRIDIPPRRVDELASSMQRWGLINPITVRPTPMGFQIVAGNTRALAAKRLGWTTIPATCHDHTSTDAACVRLVENVQRSNLTPVEEAASLHHLLSTIEGGVDQLAALTGRSVDWVLNRLEIVDWPSSLVDQVHHKRIGLGAAKHLARIQPPSLREERIHQAAQYHIDTRTASLWRQDSLSTPPTENVLPLNPTPSDLREFVTNTTVVCYACKNRIDVQQTLPTHICTHCHSDFLGQASRIPTPPE
jgi:ParB family chromosome partitioning protein